MMRAASRLEASRAAVANSARVARWSQSRQHRRLTMKDLNQLHDLRVVGRLALPSICRTQEQSTPAVRTPMPRHGHPQRPPSPMTSRTCQPRARSTSSLRDRCGLRGFWRHDTLSWAVRKITCAPSWTWTRKAAATPDPHSLGRRQSRERFLTSLTILCATLEAGPVSNGTDPCPFVP